MITIISAVIIGVGMYAPGVTSSLNVKTTDFKSVIQQQAQPVVLQGSSAQLQPAPSL